MSQSSRTSLSLILIGTLGLGCGASAGEDPPAQEGLGKRLAEVRLSETHSVVFVENEMGQISMLERGALDEIDARIDTDALAGLSFAEKYAAIARASRLSDTQPPPALIDAERRAEQLAALAGTVLPPDAAEATNGVMKESTPSPTHHEPSALASPSIDYDADAQWWKTNFCSTKNVDATWCPTNITWAHSGWEPTMYFESVCLAASQSASAGFWVEQWNGSAWVRTVDMTIAARTWVRSVDERTVTRRAGCDGLSPDPHVDFSIRTRWATPTFVKDSDFPSNRSIDTSNDIQGVTHDSTHWYFTAAATFLSRVEGRIWKVPLTSDLRDEPRYKTNPWAGVYNHFGDPVQVGGLVYVPLETGGGNGSAGGAIGVFMDDLSVVGRVDIPSDSPQTIRPPEGGNAAPWIAYNPKDKLFYSSRYHDTQIHKYAIGVLGNPLRVVIDYKGSVRIRDGNGTAVSTFGYQQGGKFSASGKLYVTRWLASGGIFVVDPINGRIQTKIPVVYDKSDSEELEGLDILNTTGKGVPGIDSQVHVIMIQNEDLSNDDWYFKHFNVADFGKL